MSKDPIIDQIHEVIAELGIVRFSSKDQHAYTLLFEFSKLPRYSASRRYYFELTKSELKQFSGLAWFARCSVDDQGVFLLDGKVYDCI